MEAPSLYLPSTAELFSLPNLLGTFIPTYLADNERGNLNWKRDNPPDPSYQRIGAIGDGSCFFHAACKGLSKIYQLSYQKFPIITEEILQGFENSIQRNNLFSPFIFNPIRSNKIPNTQYIIINQMDYERSMQTFRSVFVKLLREDFAKQLETNQQWRNLVSYRLAGEIEVQRQSIVDQHARNVEQIIQQALVTGGSMNFEPLSEEQTYQQAFNIVINQLTRELRSLDSVDARYALLLSDYYNWDIYVIIDRELRDPNSKNAILSLYYNSAIQGPRNMRLPNDSNGQTPSRPSLILIHVNGGHFEIVGKVDTNTGFIKTNFDSGDSLIRQLYQLLLDIRIVSEISEI